MSVERDQTLTPLNYIDQRIRNINDRYAQCHSYVFSCVSYIEQQQMNRNIHFCTTQRGVKKKGTDGSTEYKLDDPWVVFENISNSPKWVYTDLLRHHTLNYFLRYWSVRRMELKAMLENVGPFHIFFTLSCGDRRYLEHQFWVNKALISIGTILGIPRTSRPSWKTIMSPMSMLPVLKNAWLMENHLRPSLKGILAHMST